MQHSIGGHNHVERSQRFPGSAAADRSGQPKPRRHRRNRPWHRNIVAVKTYNFMSVISKALCQLMVDSRSTGIGIFPGVRYKQYFHAGVLSRGIACNFRVWLARIRNLQAKKSLADSFKQDHSKNHPLIPRDCRHRELRTRHFVCLRGAQSRQALTSIECPRFHPLSGSPTLPPATRVLESR